MPRYTFCSFFLWGAVILLEAHWESWICSFESDVNLGKLLVIIVWIFLSLFWCWCFHYAYIIPFIDVPAVLEGWFYFYCFSLCSLCFSALEVSFYLLTNGSSASLWLHRLFSRCSEWRLVSSYSAGAAHCGGSSCLQHRVWGAQALAAAAHGLTGCSSQALKQAQQLWHMGSFPQHVGFFPIRVQTHVSCIGRWVLYHWATREPWKFLLRHPQACRFFHQPCPVFTFIKGILPFCYSIFSVWFLRRSVSLLTVPICSCILSTLSISILSVVIILVLNPWSDNSRSLSFLILMFYFFKLYILNRYFQISLKRYRYFTFW